MSGSTSRTHHGEERRAQILDAAVRIFSEKGFDGASMRDIAREVGIAEGLIYHYFAGKEQLLHACWEAHSWQPHLERMLADSVGKPLAEVLRDLCRSFLQSLHENRSIVRLCTAELGRQGPIGAAFVQRIEQGQEKLYAFLKGRQDAGEIAPEIDVRVIGLLLMGTTHSVYHLWCAQSADHAAAYQDLLLTQGVDAVVRGTSYTERGRP